MTLNSKRMAKLAGLLKEGWNDKDSSPDYDASYDGGPGPFGDEAKEYLAIGERQSKKDKDPVGFRIEELENEVLTLRDRVKTLEAQMLDIMEQAQK